MLLPVLFHFYALKVCAKKETRTHVTAQTLLFSKEKRKQRTADLQH